jgi:hypothetical protein
MYSMYKMYSMYSTVQYRTVCTVPYITVQYVQYKLYRTVCTVCTVPYSMYRTVCIVPYSMYNLYCTIPNNPNRFLHQIIPLGRKDKNRKLMFDLLKPVLASEREARLKEERCRGIIKPDPNAIPNGPCNAQIWEEQVTQTSTTLLAFGVVFGHACGAASTTLQLEKRHRKTMKNIYITKKQTQNI